METNGGDCATARGDLLDSKPKKVAADKTTNDLNATGDKYSADALVFPWLTTKQRRRCGRKQGNRTCRATRPDT